MAGFSYPKPENGTWNVTLYQNTNLPITVLNGSSTNIWMPQDVADLASGFTVGDTNTTANTGIQPRSVADIGLPAVFGNLTITNWQIGLVDNLRPDGLNTATWSQSP